MQTPKLHPFLKQCADDMIELENQRAQINGRMSVIRSKIKSQGMDVKAFNLGLTHYKLDKSEARAKFDRSLNTTRKALGIELQTDMFDNVAVNLQGLDALEEQERQQDEAAKNGGAEAGFAIGGEGEAREAAIA